MRTAPLDPSSMEFAAALAQHLRRRQWTHFVTLTSRVPSTYERLRRSFEHEFIRRLTRAAQRPVPWFVAAEAGASGLNLHLHALVAITTDLSLRRIEHSWKLGDAHAVPYDSTRGAANYILKEIRVHPDWYDVSRRLPKLLRNCAEDRPGVH